MEAHRLHTGYLDNHCLFKHFQQQQNSLQLDKSWREKSSMTTLFLCLSLLIAAVQFSTVDSALPCNSPLRRYLPDQFTHCASCSYGQWSSWTRFNPPQEITNLTCATGKASRYKRSRTALPGSTCTPDPELDYKYECKQLQMTMYLEHWIIVCALPVFNSRCSNTEAESGTDYSSTSSWSRC